MPNFMSVGKDFPMGSTSDVPFPILIRTTLTTALYNRAELVHSQNTIQQSCDSSLWL